MTVDELRKQIAHHLQDPDYATVNSKQILTFINDAAGDAGNEDWIVPFEDDETTTLSSGVFEYTVPASFTYIHELIQESGTGTGIYSIFIPWQRWQLRTNGGVSIIDFSRELFTIASGSKIKVRGHKRPKANYVNGTETIETGMESFLRERAKSYGATYLMHGASTRARTYDPIFEAAWNASEAMLQHQPDEFRPKKFSRKVPLR